MVISLLFLIASAVVQSAPPYIPEAHFYQLEDTTGTLPFNEVKTKKEQGRFLRVHGNQLSSQHSGAALWLHFSLAEPALNAPNTLLVVGPAYVDELTLYRSVANHEVPATIASGDAVPFVHKPYANRLHVFSLPAEAADYYLRVASEGVLRIEWKIQEEALFTSSNHTQAVGYGILFGILASMILYNLGIYVSTKNTAYLYYVIYHACAGLLLFSLNGYASQLLWPNSSNSTNISIPLAINGMCLSGLLFNYKFLELGKQLPKVAKWVRAIFITVLLLAILSLLLPYGLGRVVTYVSAVLVMCTLGYAITVAWKNKIRSAKYLVITFACAIFPGVLGILVYEQGWLPDYVVFSHILELTTVVETMLLSLFLANSIKLLEIEKKLAQKRIIQLQQSFNQRMLARQEEDRSHLARELHDSIGQSLSLLHINLRSREAATLEDLPPMMSDKQILDLVKKTIFEVRQLSHQLHPSQLNSISLIRAIHVLIKQVRVKKVPEFKMAIGIEDKQIAEDKKIHLYRIVQEALNNLIKHADASHCYISLAEVNNVIQLSIRDDGCGFCVGKVPRYGLGMTSLADRADIINAKLNIKSELGRGTTISVTFEAETHSE